MKSHLFWWPWNFSIVDYYRSQRSALDAYTRNCRTERFRRNNLEAQSLPGTLWNRAVQKSPAVRSYGERERSTRVVTGPVVFNKGQSFRGPKVHSWLATGCRSADRRPLPHFWRPDKLDNVLSKLIPGHSIPYLNMQMNNLYSSSDRLRPSSWFIRLVDPLSLS